MKKVITPLETTQTETRRELIPLRFWWRTRYATYGRIHFAPSSLSIHTGDSIRQLGLVVKTCGQSVFRYSGCRECSERTGGGDL